MVLSEAEKKERKRIVQKNWRDKNKEKLKEYQKKYFEENKEILIENKRKYNETQKGKKVYILSNWKKIGVLSKDYNLLYDNYLKSTNCEVCDIEYGKRGDGTGTFKCLDHCHETGLFRNFICCGCNKKRG